MSLPKYNDYKESRTYLGEIPAGWSVMRIMQVASLNDDALPESTEPSYEIEYVDIGSVSLIDGIERTERFSFSDSPSRARRLVRHGDILVSTVRTYLKAIAPIVAPPENMVVSTGFAVVRPKENLLPELGKYLLQAPGFVDEVISRSTGVSYPAINASDLARIFIPIPPLTEQIKIAAFLDHETAKIDALIAEQEKLVALLAEKRQATISHAVTRGLNPDVPMKDSGVAWLGEVPAHWELKAVWMLFEMGRGRVISHEDISHNLGDFPVYSSQTEHEGVMGHIKTYDFDGDYLTWTTDGANAGTVFRRSGKFNCTNVCGTLLPKRKDYNLEYFLDAVGISTAAYIRHDINPKLMNKVMSSIRIPVPPITEQIGISEYLNSSKEKYAALTNDAVVSIALLRERRSALIAAAVTGQIDVRGWAPNN